MSKPHENLAYIFSKCPTPQIEEILDELEGLQIRNYMHPSFVDLRVLRASLPKFVVCPENLRITEEAEALCDELELQFIPVPEATDEEESDDEDEDTPSAPKAPVTRTYEEPELPAEVTALLSDGTDTSSSSFDQEAHDFKLKQETEIAKYAKNQNTELSDTSNPAESGSEEAALQITMLKRGNWVVLKGDVKVFPIDAESAPKAECEDFVNGK